ncbi:tyrosine-type recombinase/integrase [Bacillus toyonensis]|uniref:tyrosine-type recombinase/integrase n=1 Tax=Bacillus toyonensis TaxID=155322 RepID=UPI0021D08E8F|nr:tyrosine-type recombinase/integrase [Bacillus toyonensis]MCU5582982.1 tyrosine-type recombinase/integrase [Bacillus toyonensis]
MKHIQQSDKEQLGFHESLQRELLTYPKKTVQDDGSITIQQIKDPYFIINDTWNLNFIENIPQFEEAMKNYKSLGQYVHFLINNPTIKLEIKYVFHQKLFGEIWSIGTIFNAYRTNLSKLSVFLNETYPDLFSLLDLDLQKVEREWVTWLEWKGVVTEQINRDITYGEIICKTSTAYFLRTIYTSLFLLTDTREEWEKDRWDVRILHDKYGISYNKSRSDYYLNFTKIEHVKMRQQIKKYIKYRLLGNSLACSTASEYLKTLNMFLSFILRIEPEWNDLKGLKRSHMELYIQWLHEYANSNLKQKNANPKNYVKSSLAYIGKFLQDMQRFEYDIAPEMSFQLLLFSEDKPKVEKKSIDQIDYIPDYVLEQLYAHLNDLPEEVIPVVWVAFKTGLRISDVLGLTQDCLTRLNGKYSVVTDIEKTYVKGHRIPIDEDLAKILAVLIQQSIADSNQDNNPERYIFIRYRGSRKGKPYSQRTIGEHLNILAHKKQIVDEKGEVFYFKCHQFRHTYAVKLLNGGADILTVQELLAHASPEMTLRYAKLLDDTKRKVFESVINQGVFSFDLNGEVQEIKAGEDIPQDILQALWQNHKLNAMDNPYGTCHARLKGDCPHMEAPPCLTCNGGSPCKDLAIGFSELDVEKYEMHVKTTTRAIEVAKQHGREDMAEKHERHLQRYHGILSNIREGNIIFGRQERMKRK